MSRACYQGIPWIVYALNRYWYNVENKAYIKGNNCSKYFNEHYKLLTKQTKKKLKYFKPYLNNTTIEIEVNCEKTFIDNKEYNKKLLQKYINHLGVYCE